MNGAEARQYELVYVIQTSLDESGINAFDTRVRDAIATQGGTDLSSEVWGRRNLAYTIDRHYEGYYILHRFQMPPTGAAEVDRVLRFSEDVIRYMLIRKDE